MSAYAVWKFPLPPSMSDRDEFGNMVVDVDMPGVPHLLTAAVQESSICVWAGVRPEDPVKPQRFIVVPTGSRYDEFHTEYVGTAFMGSLVFHVFHCF